jgi:alpha-methylacyl-CoA racemase
MGPLKGIKVVEMAGLAPGPFAAMMLADMGAQVLRVERPGQATPPGHPRLELLNRSRLSIALDLKSPAGVGALRRLLIGADAFIEGFRPGVMERLGLGPEPCLAANPRLVYGRMTGWGQDGPLAKAAGHDINYIG